MVFFEPKSSLKDDIYWLLKSSCFERFDDGKYSIFLSQEVDREDDIYWLLKRSCFKLFGGGKYSLFWVTKLMERWYLLVSEKFLFWTFRWLEIRSFYQPYCWWKDDIYLVFFSFPWYSRTWEIRLFVQWQSAMFNSPLPPPILRMYSLWVVHSIHRHYLSCLPVHSF